MISYWILTLAVTLFFNYFKIYSKGKTNKLANDLLDLMPIFLLILFPINKLLFLFVVGVCFANSVIRSNDVAGGVLYAITYIATFMFIYSYSSIAWLSTIIPLLIVCGIGFFAIKKKLTDTKIILAGMAYGIVVFCALTYLYTLTLNLGFLALILGDILLAIQFVYKKNFIYLISNSLFYIGVFLIPFSLV